MNESSVNYVEDSITKEVMLPGQEKYIAGVNHENREANKTTSLEMDIDTLEPINNNVIIRCKKRTRSAGGIHYISGDKTYETKQIFRVSKLVKELNPIVTPGKYCHVLMTVICSLPEAKPCMKEEINGETFEYWKISAEQIEYIYDLKQGTNTTTETKQS